MKIRPEFLAEFEVALEAVMASARREEACVFIFANRSADDPTDFLMFERWSSREAFVDGVMQRDYYRAYKHATDGFHREPRTVRVWTTPFDD